MTFSQAVKTVLVTKYATFQGRASRSEFWWFQLFYYGIATIIAVMALFGGIYYVSSGSEIQTSELGFAQIIIIGFFTAFFLLLVLPQIALTTRRFHDVNLSGWWYLALAVSNIIASIFSDIAGIVVALIVLIVVIRKGTTGSNTFGPNPLEAENTERLSTNETSKPM